MNKLVFSVSALVVLAAAALAFFPPSALVKALEATDVVATYAKRSSAEMLAHLPADAAARRDGAGWVFSAPDGGAEFYWDASAGPGDHVAALRVAAGPFLAAGLVPSRLPEGMLRDDVLTLGFASAASATGSAVATDVPEASFASLVDAHRERVGFHFQLEHFGLELGGGHMLEWAADPEANDLDLVFVLDPEPFLRAGVDKDAVEGWVYGTVTVHNAENGRKTEVAKFLKPFNLL